MITVKIKIFLCLFCIGRLLGNQECYEHIVICLYHANTCQCVKEQTTQCTLVSYPGCLHYPEQTTEVFIVNIECVYGIGHYVLQEGVIYTSSQKVKKHTLLIVLILYK